MTKILRIDSSPYSLEAKYHPNSKTNHLKRHGVLLRFLFKDIGFGYADCHPLEEFGDASVSDYLALLKEKKFTFLTQRSAYFAKLDAEFRKDQISAFDSFSDFPKNHFTAPALFKKEDILARKNEGFEKFKFKFGRHIPNELNYLKDNAKFFADNQLKIRIDYNGSLKQPSVLDELKVYKDILDFIEDPFSKIDEFNHSLLHQYAVDLNFAMDFVSAADDSVFSYKIVKPARENALKLKFKSPKKIVFTSSMDHPVGQVCALYDTCLSRTKEHCGLLTQFGFEPNAYGEQLIVKKTSLLAPEGTGFGFDSLLKAEKWKKCF